MAEIIIKTKWLNKNNGGAKGLAIWPFIFIGDQAGMDLLEHERTHLRQWQQWLIIFFPLAYLITIFLFGYQNSPFEKEARKVQKAYRDKYGYQPLE